MTFFPPRYDDDNDELPWFKRRNFIGAALISLAAVLVLGGWLGFQALTAKSSLEQARTSAQQAKDALLDGRVADASRFAADAQLNAQSARDATHSVPWNLRGIVCHRWFPLETTFLCHCHLRQLFKF